MLQVFAAMQEVLDNEEAHPDRLHHDICDLAGQLYLNVSGSALAPAVVWVYMHLLQSSVQLYLNWTDRN